MSFLNNMWRDHGARPSSPRRYTNQREFEADWVFGLRRKYGLSQEALATLARVSVTTIQNWENPQSRKNISEHNQERLRDIERELWIKAHVTLLEPCPPYIKALYDLMSASKDESAQALADYLAGVMDARDPGRARLLHWAGLSHSIANPGSSKAKEYEEAALKTVGDKDVPLSAAIENEILGYQMEELLKMPLGAERTEKGHQLMAACERLFGRNKQPAYKWNALEVACRTPLSKPDMFRIVNELGTIIGEAKVRQRIMTESSYEMARTVMSGPTPMN
jgi:DNA-binding transcriptional regulator YiaG